MKPKLQIVIVASLLIGVCIGIPIGRRTAPEATAPTATPVTGPGGLLCPVLRVIDGDTIDVQYTPPQIAVEERIRLLYVDTPERGEPLYKEAGEALAALIGDRPVRLEFEQPGTPERGGYGRLLAYVYLDGKNLNLELVRQGFSAHYMKYGRGRFADRFDATEREAKGANRGIWGENN